MPQLADTAIIALVDAKLGAHITTSSAGVQKRWREGNGGDSFEINWFKVVKQPPLFNMAGVPGPGYGQYTTATITREEARQRVITAAAIIIAESNGYTDARCWPKNAAIPATSYIDGNPFAGGTQSVGKLRPGQTANCNGQGKGTDRGLCQWNSNAWPGIPDTMADDPQLAVEIFWHVSEGFSKFGAWAGSKGLLPGSEARKRAGAAEADAAGTVIDETDALTDPLEDGLSAIKDWAGGLTQLLKILQDPAFWRRIGIGALGAGLLLGAIALTAGGAKSAAIKAMVS